MVTWQKRKLIIKPQKDLWWMQTYAMLPTVEYVENNRLRVYFSGRDKDNRSHIGWALIDIDQDISVIKYSKEPILSPGELGCFDDSGVTPSWIVNYRDKKYLYYIGWNQRSRTRMGLIAGLAISLDAGKTFKRWSKAPILARNTVDPYNIMTAPCVIKEGGLWKMWYVSCEGWVNEDLPRYNIKYAQSKDGIHWQRNGLVCIDFKSEQETALARPCVIKTPQGYQMWYSYKGRSYRIGYAQSKDGIKWQRKDSQVGISKSKSGWDSLMIEYAFVFKHRRKNYMFYNGNDYGKGGIGYAVSQNS